jgi:predicted flap endonuclease-1-like 5' DNA nuclease
MDRARRTESSNSDNRKSIRIVSEPAAGFEVGIVVSPPTDQPLHGSNCFISVPLPCNDAGIYTIIVEMSDSYHINLKDISLDQYKQTLKKAELIPSRRILKEQIDQRFERLQTQGISNLEDLLSAAKNAKKIADLAKNTGLSEEYLTILRREVNALLPQPKNLRDFPGVEPSIVEKLAKSGIRNSKQLFLAARGKEERTQLAQAADIDPTGLLELVKLADLSRVYGVGPIFARLLFEGGADTVETLSQADSEQLFRQLEKRYLEAGYSKADFKERDIRFCIRMAKDLPKSIEY